MSNTKDMRKGFAIVGATLLALVVGLALAIAGGASGASAAEPGDMCINIDGIQVAVPEGMEQSLQGDEYSGGWVCIPADEAVPGIDPVEAPPVVEEPTYTPPVLDCSEGTVPGWLNEYGDPTSCVGDNPCPEVDFGVTCPADVVIIEEGPGYVREVDAPVVVAPPIPPVAPPAVLTPPVAATPVVPDRLAETGPSDFLPLVAVIGTLLASAGALMIRRVSKGVV